MRKVRPTSGRQHRVIFGERVIVNFTEVDVARMVAAVDNGYYESVSALVRDAVRKVLRSH